MGFVIVEIFNHCMFVCGGWLGGGGGDGIALFLISVIYKITVNSQQSSSCSIKKLHFMYCNFLKSALRGVLITKKCVVFLIYKICGVGCGGGGGGGMLFILLGVCAWVGEGGGL